MVRTQEKKRQSARSTSIVREKPGARAYIWELRQAFAWTWLLPLLAIAGSMLSTWLLYLLAIRSQEHQLVAIHQKTTIVLDYMSPLRNTLELLLPILGVLLVTDLIVKEWRRGTLALLTTRRPLLWFLAVRFGYFLGYLLLISTGAILLSWWLTPYPPAGLSLGVWLWQTLLTILAPTLFLSALGLLVAHLSINMIAGYVVPACCWLANWLYALQVEQAHTLSPVLSYLLFGWSDKDLTPQPEAWLPGKLTLCILVILLLALQPLLLRQVALQHREAE